MKLINKIIDNPKVFFDELGGLHDTRINSFSWDKKDCLLKLSIDDLNNNFLDLPEYKGLKPVDIIFSSVSSLEINIQIFDHTNAVYAVEIETNKDGYLFEIKCSPGGYLKFQCDAVSLVE